MLPPGLTTGLAADIAGNCVNNRVEQRHIGHADLPAGSLQSVAQGVVDHRAQHQARMGRNTVDHPFHLNAAAHQHPKVLGRLDAFELHQAGARNTTDSVAGRIGYQMQVKLFQGQGFNRGSGRIGGAAIGTVQAWGQQEQRCSQHTPVSQTRNFHPRRSIFHGLSSPWGRLEVLHLAIGVRRKPIHGVWLDSGHCRPPRSSFFPIYSHFPQNYAQHKTIPNAGSKVMGIMGIPMTHRPSTTTAF